MYELTDEQFDKLISAAMDELPQEYIKGLDNVAIVMADDPTEEQKRTARLGEVINKLELLITKNRSGATGTLDLFADMPCNYFADAYTGGAA